MMAYLMLSRTEKAYLNKGFLNAALAEYSFRLGIPKGDAKKIIETYFVSIIVHRN